MRDAMKEGLNRNGSFNFLCSLGRALGGLDAVRLILPFKSFETASLINDFCLARLHKNRKMYAEMDGTSKSGNINSLMGELCMSATTLIYNQLKLYLLKILYRLSSHPFKCVAGFL